MNPTQLPTIEPYPFDVSLFVELPEKAEPLKLGAIAIPAYGSVTKWESEQIEAFWAENPSVETTPMSDIQLAMATILLRSRYREDWTAEMSARLPLAVLGKCLDFVVNEQTRWRDITPADALAELPQKKPELTTEASTGESDKPTRTKKSLVTTGGTAAQSE